MNVSLGGSLARKQCFNIPTTFERKKLKYIAVKFWVSVAEWVARQTAEQEVGGSNPGIPPLVKHTCGEGDWLLCWHYTPAKVLHQRWISGNVYHVCLCIVWIRQNPLWLWNPEETSPEVQNRGISGPTNGHVSDKNLKKKKFWVSSPPSPCTQTTLTDKWNIIITSNHGQIGVNIVGLLNRF